MKTSHAIIILLLILLIAGLIGSKEQQEQEIHAIIGLIESDADYCMTPEDITIINQSSLTDIYKNYLIEIDYRNQSITPFKCKNLL